LSSSGLLVSFTERQYSSSTPSELLVAAGAGVLVAAVGAALATWVVGAWLR